MKQGDRDLEDRQRERLERVLAKAAVRRGNLASTPRSDRETAGDRLVIKRAPRDEPIPLAVAQERFWFLHQLDPDSPADNIAVALRLEGVFQRDAYQGAWDEILRRHEILRTRFPIEAGQPTQVIDAPQPAVIRFVDLANPIGGSDDTREAAVIAAAAEEADRPFSLATAPPHRLTVFRVNNDVHLILGVFHHIICDLWALGVISHELAEVYAALAEGRSPALPELPFQYADYAVSHRRWVDGPAIAPQLEYWQQRLSGFSAPQLPTDRSRQRTRGAGATGVIDLPPGLLAAVRVLASEEGATPFMVLIAAFTLLLGRYTGETDIVVGTPIANRTRLDLKGLVGSFVNTLPFRNDLGGVRTFRELLSRTREAALGAFAHQDVPFHRLVNELDVNRSEPSPVFQVLFNVQNAPVRLPQFPQMRTAHVNLPRRAAQFDLTVWVDTNTLHQIGYAFDTGLFDRATIERLVTHYLEVLRSGAERPDAMLADLELLMPEERDTILRDFNRTSIPLTDDTVADLFTRQAQLSPKAAALEVGGAVITYEELEARSARVASVLRTRGVGAGALVGICLDRSASLVTAMLGVIRSGAAYLPLDPTLPPDWLALKLRDSGAAMVLSEPALAGLVPHSVEVLFATVLEGGDSVDPAMVEAPAVLSGDDLAYVIYTSGSTGQPKGVEVPHRALANLLHSMAKRPGLEAGDRLLAVTPVSFDIAALEIFLPLVTGATIVMASREDTRNPARLSELIERERVSVMQATPATWRMLVDTGWAGQSKLTILCGGEALGRDLAECLLARSRAVWNLFGPTETTIWSTLERVEPGQGPVSIGRPIANTQVYVLDEHRRPLPIGVPGELYIAGEGVARGYRNRPDLTAERFVVHSFFRGAEARLFRTGDRACFLPDGRLEWLGRLDDQVKVRGHRVELGEVEAGLRKVPGVKDGAVVVREDAAGAGYLTGFVVAHEHTSVNAKQVRDHLARHLPSYMVPSQIAQVSALPLTRNGKVNRAALRAMPLEETAVPLGATPTTQTERRLSEIWCKLLGVPRLGVDDDFFDCGGHSLLAVGLVSAIEREFGQPLGVATLIEARTIRQLAQVVERQKPVASWGALVVLQPRGNEPPFYCVHGVGGEVLGYTPLALRMGNDRPFVGIQAIDEIRSADPVHGITAQAAAYVREIRRFQPNGPYHLGGYSHGGRVALEMALRLEAEGERVAFLGVLDTTPVGVHYNSLGYWLRVARNAPRWLWYDGVRTPWRENVERVRRALRRRRGLLTARVPADTRLADVRDTMDVSNLPPAYLERYRWDYLAFCSYVPAGRCQAGITVFKAKGQPLLASHDPDLGWSAVTRGSVEVVEVAGNHTSILTEPNVTGLADALRTALEASARKT